MTEETNWISVDRLKPPEKKPLLLLVKDPNGYSRPALGFCQGSQHAILNLLGQKGLFWWVEWPRHVGHSNNHEITHWLPVPPYHEI